MKIIIFGVFLIAILLNVAEFCAAQSHNHQFGSIRFNDVILAREVIKKSAGVGYISEEFRYPATDFSPSGEISAVIVKDMYTDGHGGETELLYGGPGDRKVGLKFSSQLFRGLYFEVEVWGRAVNM